MNTPTPTEKPRTPLFRRILRGLVAFGECLARGGRPPPREPKPGEFWPLHRNPQNPWEDHTPGARVLEVKNEWVRYDETMPADADGDCAIKTRADRISVFLHMFHPPDGVRPPRAHTGPL